MGSHRDASPAEEGAAISKQDVELKQDPVEEVDGSAVLSETKEQPQEYLEGFKLYIILVALTFIFFLMMLDMSIIVTAIPRITSDFQSLPDVGWYGSAYLLASCALQPLTGKIYTQLNSKYTYLAFLVLFEIGSVLCGAAQSSKMMIIGRAVAGLGCSGIANGSMTIMSEIAPLHRQPMILGIMMSFSQIGIVSGPLIGGALTQYASWRWCFYINVPIGGACAALLVFIKIPDQSLKTASKRRTFGEFLSKLDLIGCVFFASFAIMFFFALERGGVDYPWNSPTIIGLFCASGVTLLIFCAWEYRVGDDAMIPPAVVKQRIVICACCVMGFFYASLMIFSYYLPIYFQAVRGVSPSLSGVYVLPGILGQMVTAGVSGALVGKLGYYLPWSVGSAAVVTVAAGLVSTFTPHTPTAKWVVYQLLAGLGRGCGFQMPLVAIQNNISKAHIPIGIALLMFAQTFSGSLFLAFGQTIFNHSLTSGLKQFAPAVDPQTVISAGAAAIPKVVSPEDLPGVLEAYNLGFRHNFYLAAGASAATFLFSWGLGWKKIEKEKKKASTEV